MKMGRSDLDHKTLTTVCGEELLGRSDPLKMVVSEQCQRILFLASWDLPPLLKETEKAT